MRIRRIFQGIIRGIKQSLEDRASELVKLELRELENVFILTILSPLIGIPGPSTIISLRLLPYLERELIQSIRTSERLDDAAFELIGYLDIT